MNDIDLIPDQDQEVLVLRHLGLDHLIKDNTPIDIDNDDAPQPRDYDIRANQYVEDDVRELAGMTGQSAISEDLFDSQYAKWHHQRKKDPNNNNNNNNNNRSQLLQIKEELPSDFSGSMIPPTYPSDNSNHGSNLLRKRKLEDTDPFTSDGRPVKRARSPVSGEDENRNQDAALDDWAADVSLDWGIGDNNLATNNADWDQQFV